MIWWSGRWEKTRLSGVAAKASAAMAAWVGAAHASREGEEREDGGE